jgi:hypothetical protein
MACSSSVVYKLSKEADGSYLYSLLRRQLKCVKKQTENIFPYHLATTELECVHSRLQTLLFPFFLAMLFQVLDGKPGA